MYRSRKVTKTYNPSKVRKTFKTTKAICPFCNIETQAGELIKQNKSACVLKNRYPYHFWDYWGVDDHLMVVPKRHVENLADLNKAELLDYTKLLTEFEKKGYSFFGRASTNATKTVPHQHTHLIKTNTKNSRFILYLKKPYIVLNWQKSVKE